MVNLPMVTPWRITTLWGFPQIGHLMVSSHGKNILTIPCFSPEIGHPMVKSHGEITHGVTMGIYNPMVFFPQIGHPMVSSHGKISLQSHGFFPKIGHPMVKSHGEFTHGVTMGLTTPWFFSRKLATPWCHPMVNIPMVLTWDITMGTYHGVANFWEKAMGFFLWESHEVFL